MAQFNTFNYADVVGTGEAVKGQRLKNAMLEAEMDPNSLPNQQRRTSISLAKTQQRRAEQQIDEATQIDNSRFALSAFRQMAQDPTTAVQHYPALIERGILPPEADYTTLDPAVIQQDSAAAAERMEMALEAYGQQHTAPQAKGDTIDQYLRAKQLGIIRKDMSYDEFAKIGKTPLVQIGADGSTGPGPITPEQTQALAEDAGVPVAVTTPWAHLQDPKEIDKMKTKAWENANKAYEKLSENAENSQATINDIDRFLFLNKSNYTGAGMMVPGAKGLRKGFDPEFGEMVSLSDKLTPRMRQGMPGAASDRDVIMFKNATVGTEQDPEANLNIGMGLKIAEQNKIERAKFFRGYIDSNRHDMLAAQAWDAYLEANPIFDPDAEPGSYKLNENRLTPREYFYPDEAGGSRGETGGGMSDEEYRQRRAAVLGGE